MPFDWFVFATMLMAIWGKSFGIPIIIAVLLFTAPTPIERPKTGIRLLTNAIAASLPAPKSLRLLKDQSGRKVINVKHVGAKGDGLTSDTAAVQAAIDVALDGSTIYFPAGTYGVSNFRVNNRSGLSFAGEGSKSLIQQRQGAGRIATFDGSSNITITNLAFDANGIDSFGGVVFYGVTNVRIENTFFFDSQPKPLGSKDRYAYVFGRGRTPSKEIQIINNRIDDLQLEVDHAQRVLIEENTVSRAVRTAGIGIFTVGDHGIAEDYLITRNTIIDPVGVGFNIGIDPPQNQYCVFRRIKIINNKIIRAKTSDYAIRIGTPNNSVSTIGNAFEDIVIKDNLIQIHQTAPEQRTMIIANSSAVAGLVFTRLIVTDNRIENNGPSSTGYVIDLRRPQHSTVAGNSVKGAVNGISLAVDLLRNEVRDNVVEATGTAYRLEGSLGENKAHNNRILGSPQTQWKVSGLKASDSVEIEQKSPTPH